MKCLSKYIVAIIIMCNLSFAANAQEVNTLYFLENAPTRHIINPAFQPHSNVYVLLPAVGNISLGIGNNAFTMKDLIFQDPTTGQTITALHPNAEGELWNALPKSINIDTDLRVNLLSFGGRVSKGRGYFHVNISERIGLGLEMPKTVLGPLLGQGLSQINFNSLNVGASLYSEVAIGYSHMLNEKWTVGGTIKVLLGHAYMRGYFNELNMTSTEQLATIHGDGNLQVAGLINTEMLDGLLEGQGFPSDYFPNQFLEDIKPSGYGAAIDMGVTYKPFKFLQVSAAVTDLGFVYWNKGGNARIAMDTTFTGVGDLQYADYTDANGNFQSDAFMDDVVDNLSHYIDALHIEDPQDKPFASMMNATLNIGVDVSCWKNRLGLGVYSRTQFYMGHVSEEVTVGAFFRPFRCFNLAASYSFINGHWSNLGAGLSVAPYDGIMLTLTTDYIPLSFAAYNMDGTQIQIPYQTGYVNASLGMAIVIGTSKKRNK